MTALTPYRISGDESFPCRYTWLPKAVRGLDANPMLFSNDDQAMVDLGLGKNMVRSVRFWAHAAGMAAPVAKGGGYKPTDFGSALLGPGGLDPFLEDIRTLWLIHWKLSMNRTELTLILNDLPRAGSWSQFMRFFPKGSCPRTRRILCWPGTIF